MVSVVREWLPTFTVGRALREIVKVILCPYKYYIIIIEQFMYISLLETNDMLMCMCVYVCTICRVAIAIISFICAIHIYANL